MLPIWWYNRGWFPLGNKYWGLRSEWVKREVLWGGMCNWTYHGRNSITSWTIDKIYNLFGNPKG